MRLKILNDWGADLDDDAFALAVTALGILSAKTGGASTSKLVTHLKKDNLVNTFNWAIGNSILVAWRHPDSCAAFWKDNLPDAARLANAWFKFKSSHREILRLILDDLTAEFPSKNVDVSQYAAVLNVLTSTTKSAFFRWRSKRTASWNWPLRFGFLNDPKSAEIGAGIGALYPFNTLGQSFPFSRHTSHCDIAVLPKSPEEHLKELLESPFGERAGIVVFTGGMENTKTLDFSTLKQIGKKMWASGFFTTLDPIKETSRFINNLVLHLSHNAPIDIALFSAARDVGARQPIVFLDPEFASRAQLTKVATSMAQKLEGAGETLIHAPAGLMGRFPFSGPESALAGDNVTARMVGQVLKEKTSMYLYAGESHEATAFAEAKPMLDAAVQKFNSKSHDHRYIQAQVKPKGPSAEGSTKYLVVGSRYKLNVRIATFDDKWLNPKNKEPFPDELLPENEDEHRLRIILSEPYHISKPLVRSVKMKSVGASTTARFEFEPQPGEMAFRARLTVTHRNRILQTALLQARVMAEGGSEQIEGDITLEIEAIIRPSLQNLTDRTRFDVALAFNHALKEEPMFLGLAGDRAVLRGMSQVAGKVNAISNRLSEVALSSKRYAEGLEGKDGVDLLRFLAEEGRDIYDYLIKDQVLRKQLLDAEYLQIVSLSPDAYFPAEFIYQFAVPADDATVCPVGLKALKTNDYSNICSLDNHAASPAPHVCPFGFWGLRRVIERHAWIPGQDQPLGDYVLQAEPCTGRNVLEINRATLFAASNHVNEESTGAVEALFNRLRQLLTSVRFAKKWEDWSGFIGEQGPTALIALPHVEMKQTYGDTKYFLEIGGYELQTNLIGLQYVKQNADAPPPIVILLGCNITLPQSAIDSIVGRFRRAGAAIVIGTVATVLGSHSSAVAQEIAAQIASLEPGKEVPFGELLLTVRRRAMGSGILMVMCVGGFGDADWLIKT